MTHYEKAESLGLTSIDRWSECIEHHEMSVKLMIFFKEHDNKNFGSFFNWRTGGDGDNREVLMYQMDAFFEMQDKK